MLEGSDRDDIVCLARRRRGKLSLDVAEDAVADADVGFFDSPRGCGSKGAELPAQPETGTGISYDSAAVVGGWNEADMDKIVEGLNEQVEAGMINISMNTSPIFSDGTSEGNLMIVNEGVNRYPQVVEIARNDTGETIYKSGAIPVGSKIEKARLSANLDAGTYECTALFYNVDPDTGDYLGCAGAIITITVLD